MIRLNSVTSHVTILWAWPPPNPVNTAGRPDGRTVEAPGPPPGTTTKHCPHSAARGAQPSCWTRVGLGMGLASGGPSCPRETPPRRYHGDVGLEDLLDELVSGGVDQLDDVSMQGVPVLLQEAWAVARNGRPHLKSSGSFCLRRLSRSPNPRCLSKEDPRTSLSSTTPTLQRGTLRPG